MSAKPKKTPAENPAQRLQSQLMSFAYNAIFEAKISQTYVPLRTLRHFPNFDSILSPINPDHVNDLSADIMCTGYRRNEPVFCTPLMPDLKLPRFIVGGNHRCAACRGAGVVLIPAHPISETIIEQMMQLVEHRDPPETRGNVDVKVKRFDTCVELMMVATQIKEPSPTPPTILQQVSLIRTFVNNDPEIHERAKKHPRAVYGGYNILRHAMFGEIPLTSNNNAHFLLNKEYVTNPTHINKCLAGAKKLIQTNLRRIVTALRNHQTLLDLLLYWERMEFVPNFNVSHLCHIGEISTEDALSIAERTTEELYESIRDEPEKIYISEAPFAKRRIIRDSTSTRHGEKEKKIRSLTHKLEMGKMALSKMRRRDLRMRMKGVMQQLPLHLQQLLLQLPKLRIRLNTGTKTLSKSAETPSGSAPELRRSHRKRTKFTLDNFVGFDGPSVTSKKRKTANASAIVTKLHKEVDEERDRVGSLQTQLRNLNRVLHDRDVRIDEQLKKRQAEKDRAKKAVQGLEAKLSKELKAKFDAQFADAEMSSKQRLLKLEEELKKANDAREVQDKVLADMREAARKELEEEVKRKVDSEVKAFRTESERLRRDGNVLAKGVLEKSNEIKMLLNELEIKNTTSAGSSDTVKDELERLRKENEELKKKSTAFSNASFSIMDELNKLRNENDQLKCQFEERISGQPNTSKGKRNVLPSDKVLHAMSKKQLEAFLSRANRILNNKSDS